jgi:ABC-2 type transport system ATP-binding protein
MSEIVRVDDVRKTFSVWRKRGRLRRERVLVDAVDGITFAVARGETVGYVGPNGAGKSTTIKMLTGVLVPTSGRVTTCGLVPSRDRVALARRIGVVFGQRSLLWWDLPLEDSFGLLRHLYRVEAEAHRARLDDCIERLELGPFLGVPVRQLSLGQRMRGELTAALLHGPELLVLDEPTVGLDVVSKAKVREFLRERNQRSGTTILLTSHDLDDIEHLCDRLLIIDQGRLVHDGSLDDLRARFGDTRTLVVDLTVAGPPIAVAGATVTRIDGPRQWLQFSRAATTAAALVGEIARSYPLRDLSIEEPAIEDIVRRIYTRNHGG